MVSAPKYFYLFQEHVFLHVLSHFNLYFSQVTTHSKLLSSADKSEIANATEIPNVMLETLQAFDTEQQFSCRIRYQLFHMLVRLDNI